MAVGLPRNYTSTELRAMRSRWKPRRLTTVPAMTIVYPVHHYTPPQGWDTVVHPEGSLYFVNIEKRTSTKINICDKENCEKIERHMKYLLDELQNQPKLKKLQLDMEDLDLVIEPMASGDSGYYFINHRDKCLFWLDEFDVEARLPHCKGIKDLACIGLAIQVQYWEYQHCFPHLCPVTQDLVDEVENMLVHATCDHLASNQPSAPYNVSVLRNYLSAIKRIKVSPASQSVEQYRNTIVISQIMRAFSYNAFMIFIEEAAKKRRDAGHASWTPSRWMVVVAPILFLEPVTRIRELEEIFTNDVARVPRWNVFSSRMKRELQDSNLLATVFLSANVVLLGVIKSGGNSVTQVTNYASLATSLGSLVLGLFFVSQYRISGQSVTDDMLSTLSKLSLLSGLYDEIHGHEKLATIYSLPKALLVWGIVFFFATFSIDWWTSGGDTASRVFVGVVILLTSMITISSIIRTTEGDLWWWTGHLHMVIRQKPSSPISRTPRGLRWWTGYLRMVIHLKPSSSLGISRMQRNDDDKPETNQFSMRIPAGPLRANTRADEPMHNSSRLENPNASTSTTFPASPRQLNVGNSMSHSRTSSSLSSEVGSSRHLRKDTRTVSQDQPIGEARSEPEHDHTSSHVRLITSTVVDEPSHSDGTPTKTIIPSKHEERTAPVATDSRSPDPLYAEEGESVKCRVEEVQALEIPQVREAHVRRATDDELYHAPPAAKQTLEDNAYNV